MIGRREFISLLGGAVAWPLAARAQQSKHPIIGFLGRSTRSAASERVAAFVCDCTNAAGLKRTIAMNIAGLRVRKFV